MSDPASPQASRANPAATTVTFVGHSTVAIEDSGTRLLTDPLLRDGLLGFLRRRPPLRPLGPAGRPDAILISHLHYDHLDFPSLRSLPSGTPIVAPRGSGRFLARRGFHDVVELDEGQGLRVGGMQVTAMPARHGSGGRPRAGRVGSLGYLVEATARVYFAGDTELFEGMREIGRGLDCALLPIWGWGPRLGPGHLDPFTAAEALRLLEPRIAVPIHWGSYTPLGARRLWPWLETEAASRFVRDAGRRAPGVEVRVLGAGESLDLDRVG
jgi:L-ascorbate metabolism protein UlaG (beta-lactamase superfamily)